MSPIRADGKITYPVGFGGEGLRGGLVSQWDDPKIGNLAGEVSQALPADGKCPLRLTQQGQALSTLERVAGQRDRNRAAQRPRWVRHEGYRVAFPDKRTWERG